jgi:hypothetical protein
MNVSKPRKNSDNTKKCAVNVSARYLWRDWQLRQYIAFVEGYFTSSAFVSRALTDRRAQALLAPNYRWLDPQQPFQKGPFVERNI